MSRIRFSFEDLRQDCRVVEGSRQLDGRSLGLSIEVPPELQGRYPYSASAYVFLQQLRRQIFDYGLVAFPDLPVNRTNHTLAQRAPREHAYSSNRYLTDSCQLPHQDTPPYPTAFWLGRQRRYFATWVVSEVGLTACHELGAALSVEALHQLLVPRSLNQGFGLLVNQAPGLLLIDNSRACGLYHARTCNFEAMAANPEYQTDTPMYAYNETGLLSYIDLLDSRRGEADRDVREKAEVEAFMAREQLPSAY